MKRARVAALLVLAALAGPTLLAAQEQQPLVAGSDGVPSPKKTKDVKPVYPQQAIAQGLRGIVIVEVVIDPRGAVSSVAIVRSVPGLDEAAIAAARQWRYEPVKVDGRPVSVRLTVPVIFSLELPKLERAAGIPDLRQGVTPAFPQGGKSGTAAAEVTLEPDGRIASANVVAGDEPWTGALLDALKTWRFSPPPEEAVLSFRVEAEFSAGAAGPKRLTLRATGLRTADLLDAAHLPAAGTTAPAPAAAPSTGPTGERSQSDQGAPGQQKPPQAPPEGAPAAPGSAPDTPPPPVAPPSTGAPPPAPGSPGTTTPPPTSVPPPTPAPPATPTPQPGGDRSAPPTEVITVPPPAPPPENGISAVRDVTLEPGVPELAKGRRPVPPPLARMVGATGTVEVAFSVSAAGTTLIQNVNGPDLLKKAAEQAVASWVFRRTRADRAYLFTLFTYGVDKASATVRPQAAPANATGAVPAVAPALAAPQAAPGLSTTPPGAPGPAVPGDTAPPSDRPRP